MSNIEPSTYDCYNLMTRYEFKRYHIDSNPVLLRNRWVAFTQYSNINDKIEKQLTIQSILDTNTDDFKVQKDESLPTSRSFKDYHNYHNYKSIEKNKHKTNQEGKQFRDLLCFAGPEQIVYE